MKCLSLQASFIQEHFHVKAQWRRRNNVTGFHNEFYTNTNISRFKLFVNALMEVNYRDIALLGLVTDKTGSSYLGDSEVHSHQDFINFVKTLV